MTPSEDLLAGSQRQSFDGTEYRSIFSAGWRKKFFCGQAQKKAQPSEVSEICAFGGGFHCGGGAISICRGGSILISATRFSNTSIVAGGAFRSLSIAASCAPVYVPTFGRRYFSALSACNILKIIVAPPF